MSDAWGSWRGIQGGSPDQGADVNQDGSQWPQPPQLDPMQPWGPWPGQSAAMAAMAYPPAPWGYSPTGYPVTPDQFGAMPPQAQLPQAGFPGYPPQPPQPYPPHAQHAPQPGLVDHAAQAQDRRDYGDRARNVRPEQIEHDVDEGSGDDEEEVGDGDDEDKDNHAMAVYCKECQTWLNGPRQWEDHKIGKKHRKNVQKARRGNATSSSSAVGEEKETPDEVPAKKTDMWQWLEDGKAQKEAEAEEEAKNKPEGEGEKTSRSARRRRHKKEKEEAALLEAGEKMKDDAEKGDVLMPEEPAAETKEVDKLVKPAPDLETKEILLPEVAPEKDIPANVNEPKKVPPRPEFAQKVGSATSETTVPVTAN